MTGQIIWLNGTTSSGKTSIARSIQDLASEPYLLTGLDEMASRVPIKLDRERKDDEPVSDHPWFEFVVSSVDGSVVSLEIGSGMRALLASMYRSVADLATGGYNVIIDDVLIDNEQIACADETLAPFRVFAVGVRCPLIELERREMARGDRRIGLARTQVDVVHHGRTYGLEVDTSQLSAQQAAERILQACR